MESWGSHRVRSYSNYKGNVFPFQARLWPRGWVEVQLYSSMTTALEGVSGQQHAPTVLHPRERPGTHCTGGQVGPRAGLDGRKISPHRDSIPGPSSSQSVATPTEQTGPITANRPDVIITSKKQEICTLIDVAIDAVRKCQQKEAEKKLKYKNLCIEIQRMWNMNCMVMNLQFTL